MFKIENGREHFFQWDSEQRLIVDSDIITEVHYCNRTDDCSLITTVYEENGVKYSNVPNVLLQTDWPIHIYAVDENYTVYEDVFKVCRRSKPADYIYTETETLTWGEYKKQIDAELTELKALVSSIPQFEIIVVEELPPIEEALEYTIYLVKSVEMDSNLYTEYIFVNGQWELLGSTDAGDLDLTNYVKKTDIAVNNGAAGLVKVQSTNGIGITDSGVLTIQSANDAVVATKANYYYPLTSKNVDTIVKAGITTNTKQLTDEEKTKAKNWLGISNHAETATYAESAGTATNATNAGYATSAGSANTALKAETATNANTANSAGYATTAGTANSATTAENATNANHAVNADNATNANNANHADTATAANTASAIIDASGKKATIPSLAQDTVLVIQNDLANYYKKNETYNKDEVDAKVSAIPKFAIEAVNALPTSGISSTTIYLLVNNQGESNLYKEYIYINNAWEMLGEQKVDLTGYATETFVANNYQSKGNYALKSEIPAVPVQSVNGKTGAVQLTYSDVGAAAPGNYALKSEIPAVPVQSVNGKTGAVKLVPSDIGAQAAGDYALKSEIPSIPVKSVNGKTGAVSLSASDVGAVPTTQSITITGIDEDGTTHTWKVYGVAQ